MAVPGILRKALLDTITERGDRLVARSGRPRPECPGISRQIGRTGTAADGEIRATLGDHTQVVPVSALVGLRRRAG